MSSWLSGGISNWTDQISTFTKEVIAESTQEIEDPVTELQLAKKRIDEVEKQNGHNLEELKRYHKRIKELEDRAETAELQVINNNHEYKKLLQERDNELKQLRKRNSELQEQQKKLLFSSSTADHSSSIPSNDNNPTNIYPSFDTGSGMGTEGLFGDMVEGTGEYEWLGTSPGDELDYEFQSHSHVNQLQSEIARLQVECQHWKELARSKGQQIQQTDDEEDGGTSSQIQHLQLCLEEERRQHQHELTTLQALHARQLEQVVVSSQNDHSTDKIDKPQDTVLRSKSEEDETVMVKLQQSQALVNELNTFIADVRKLFKYFQDTQASQLEVEKTTLVSYLGEVQESFDEHQKRMSELHSQQLSLEEESEQLNRQVTALQKELRNKETEIDLLKCSEDNNRQIAIQDNCQQTEDLEKKLKEMESELIEENAKKEKLEKKFNEAVVTHEKEMEQVRKEMKQMEMKIAASAEDEIKQKQMQLDSASISHNEEVLRLNQELERLQEKVKAREKMAAAVDEARQLHLVNEGLGKELMNLKSTMEVKEEDMKIQKDTIQSLESKLSSMMSENEGLKQELRQTQQLLDSERGAVQATVIEEQGKMTEQQRTSQLALQKQLGNVQTEIESLKLERIKLIDDLGSETKKNSALKITMDTMKSEIEKKELEISTMREKVRNKEAEGIQDNVMEIRKLAEKNQLLLLENEKNGKEIQRLRNHLSEVNEQHDQEQIQASINETRLIAQVKMMEEKLRNKDQSDSMISLNTELQQLSKEKVFIQMEFESLKERHSRDLQSLQNLQAVLEDFQQGRNESQETTHALRKACQELERVNEQFAVIHKEKAHLETVVNEMSITCIEVKNLKFELNTAQREIGKLNTELTSYKAAMERSRITIEDISQDAVDKTLVREMFVNYLSSQDKKKNEIARLIGKILDVPQQELNRLIDGSSGWFSHLLSSSTKTSSNQPQESFSQRFISFLEAESTPTAPISHPVLVVDTPTIGRSSIPAHMQPSVKQHPTPNSSQIIGQLLDDKDGSS